jgi:signal transduction histidine kinase/CheY-like chemotaxis protein
VTLSHGAVLLVRGVRVRDSDGVPLGRVSLVEDLSALQAAERARERAARLDAARVLAAGIAHRYNNLMVRVLGNAELLRLDLPEDSPFHAMAEQVSEGATEAVELTNRILAFARGGHYQPRPLSINVVVQDVLTDRWRRRDEEGAHGPVIRTNLATNLSGVSGDAAQLREMITVLVDNAVESGSGPVVVRTDALAIEANNDLGLPPGEYVRVRVQDEGAGLSEEALIRAFEPFYSTKARGRGLGLSAAQGIAEAHAGAVRVQNREGGRGAEAVVWLPALTRRVRRARPQGDVPLVHEIRVLLVDDEAAVLQTSRRMLARLGYQLDVARDGAEAVEAIRAAPGRFGLVILDLAMPVMDGPAAFRQIRLMEPQLPILLCSGYDPNQAARDLLAEPSVGFLAKPFLLAQLASAIADTLD